ncbi:MAG: divalent metal ion transporter [Planctomycetes bacterium GWF2_41_51]|nr:MAG: divalent metal ion transporter [Planctomycetes bacterium GWF2_41_51]HBG28301.1 divalent metal ion transporter [Phycisphaerales bacterium]
MLRTLQIVENKLVESNGYNANIFVYIAPSETERKYLVDNLKIDEHTLSSTLDPDEPSRLEFEPEHTAMIFKRPRHYAPQDEFLFKALSVGMFIFSDRLVIVLADDMPLFDGKIFNKVTSLQDITLKLIFRAILHFVEHLRGINRISNELEQQVNVAMENKYLLNMFTLEKSLVYYLNAIHSNAVLISRLKTYSAKIGFTTDNLEFLDDMSIENNQCLAQTEIFSQVLSSMMDARASIISNNLNIRIKALTVLTIVIMLPTLVVSIFSMNVILPLEHDNPTSFWIIGCLALLSSVIVGLLWWRRKW